MRVSDFWAFQDEVDREVQRRDWERDIFEDEQRRSIERERDHAWVPEPADGYPTLADIEMEVFYATRRRMRSGPARDRCLALRWKTSRRLSRDTWTWRDIATAERP